MVVVLVECVLESLYQRASEMIEERNVAGRSFISRRSKPSRMAIAIVVVVNGRKVVGARP